MAQQTIHNKDRASTARNVINENFAELYSSLGNIPNLAQQIATLQQNVLDLQQQVNALEVANAYFGHWASNTHYVVGEGVHQENNFYICIMEHTSGETFNITNWKLLN